MGKRHPNPNHVKIHRSYTVEEVARCLSTHKNTVRAWIKGGLQTIDGNRPLLIHGLALRNFLQARKTRNKQKCRPGELYCFRCRAPRMPDGGMTDFESISDKLGNLVGLCPTCGTIMNQRIGMAKLERIRGLVEITITKAQRRISDSANPLVNSDFG